MQRIRKMIIILIIIFVIIIMLLGVIMLSNNEENVVDMPDEVSMDDAVDEFYNIVQVVDVRNNYYLVKRCVERFYEYYSEMFEDPLDGYLIKPEEGTVNIENLKSKSIEKVYNLLDEEYIEYNGITLDNLASKLPEIDEVSINIQNMYYIEQSENISVYFIYGNLRSVLESNSENFSMMIRLDRKNNTYKALLGDYVEEYYKDLKINDYMEFNSEEIEENTYNYIEYENISDVEYINDLFKHYKNTLRISKEQSYNLLDEEYKKICFDNLDGYLTYMEENYSKIVTANLDEYTKQKNSGYTQYLFKDTKGNYYIFKETTPFKYTVILDNYTIPTKDFTEEYESSSEAEKVVLNIKKFFMGIDDKNYGYSYSVLSESFKNNKYPTKEDFINYAEQNFFEENEIEYISYEKETGVYIYKIKITDAEGENSEERAFNIIVKLNSGTDFEMSFGEG